MIFNPDLYAGSPSIFLSYHLLLTVSISIITDDKAQKDRRPLLDSFLANRINKAAQLMNSRRRITMQA
jgi:hypothetical protein